MLLLGFLKTLSICISQRACFELVRGTLFCKDSGSTVNVIFRRGSIVHAIVADRNLHASDRLSIRGSDSFP